MSQLTSTIFANTCISIYLHADRIFSMCSKIFISIVSSKQSIKKVWIQITLTLLDMKLIVFFGTFYCACYVYVRFICYVLLLLHQSVGRRRTQTLRPTVCGWSPTPNHAPTASPPSRKTKAVTTWNAQRLKKTKQKQKNTALFTAWKILIL